MYIHSREWRVRNDRHWVLGHLLSPTPRFSPSLLSGRVSAYKVHNPSFLKCSRMCRLASQVYNLTFRFASSQHSARGGCLTWGPLLAVPFYLITDVYDRQILSSGCKSRPLSQRLAIPPLQSSVVSDVHFDRTREILVSGVSEERYSGRFARKNMP